MAGGSSLALLRDIETLFDTGTASGLSDRQLLERFAARGDAASSVAFEALVLRHGPMVLRVCRNVLRDPADAEDAFQATFLVLVRRSGSIRLVESVGGWLYGVACRVAARARVEAARRRAAEERAAMRVFEAVDPSDGDEADRAHFGPVVQEEVRRLPGKYRGVVVLCYWEGMTQEQAAAHLGCPLGTVRSRLARARTLLHRRLTRRGLAPLGGALAVALESASAGAVASRLPSVRPELVQATIAAAAQVAAGQATAQVVSGTIALLVQRMVWSMTMVKISSVMVCVVLLGLTGYGIGRTAQRAGESRSGLRVAQIDGERADQGVQAQPKEFRKATRRDPDAKTAGRNRVYSNVAGQTTILKVVADGSTVKKGDVVCELDSAALQDQLINQKITIESAKANYQNARVTREVAEIGVVEYEEGIYKQNIADLDGDIKLAEMEMSLADDELKAAKAGGNNSTLAVRRAELAKLRGAVELKKAQGRRRILVDFTKGKTFRILRLEVEKAYGNELAKRATWDLETSKEKILERQIASCTIVAPFDGKLVYARPHEFRGGGGMGMIPTVDGVPLVPIEQGAIVQSRQLLFEIEPISDPKPKSP